MSTQGATQAAGRSRLGGLWRSAGAMYRAEGASGLWAGARRLVYERDDFVILRRDLRRYISSPHCTVPFELRRVDDETLRSFRSMPYPFSRHYQYRFEYGQRRCYAAFMEDRIVALMWPSFQADNQRVVSPWRYLLADEARIGSIWADPAFRGTGLMAACISRFAEYLGRRGFQYFYACTWEGNQASIRLHERLGFERVGRAIRIALRWQREGGGVYFRTRIPRDPVEFGGPGGDCELPEGIPEGQAQPSPQCQGSELGTERAHDGSLLKISQRTKRGS